MQKGEVEKLEKLTSRVNGLESAVNMMGKSSQGLTSKIDKLADSLIENTKEAAETNRDLAVLISQMKDQRQFNERTGRRLDRMEEKQAIELSEIKTDVAVIKPFAEISKDNMKKITWAIITFVGVALLNLYFDTMKEGSEFKDLQSQIAELNKKIENQ